MDPISLRWSDHNSRLVNALDHFRAVDSFVDVTLVCEGHSVKAHKIILSSGSNVLHRLLLANPAKHPIIILTETKYDTLRIIMDFLYKGKIDIPRNDLKKVLQVANTFEINELKKLCEENMKETKNDSEPHPCLKSPDLSGSSPRKKRQRRPSSDSDILYDAIFQKRQTNSLPCKLEQPEVLIEPAETEFHPQIEDTRSVISVESPTGTRSSTQKKDASTECDIQPLKELECNSVPMKPARVTLKPRYNEITDDSESDTQNKSKFLKRKRSKIWHYFTVVSDIHAVCKICRHKLSYKTTVTNLTKHLLKLHQISDPKQRPKLPEVPLLRVQSEQLEIFEEIDFDSIEDVQCEEESDEGIPSTSTPCILKIT